MAIAWLALLVPVPILLHELGHFWCARWLGIRLAEFSVGLGVKIWIGERRGVRYVLRLFPIAAHVRPAVGSGNCAEVNPRQFIQNRPVHHQILFLAAGAIANFVTAYLVLGVGKRRDEHTRILLS